MKKWLIALLTLVLMAITPFSAFAAEEEIHSTPGSFNLIVEEPLESTNSSTELEADTSAIGGYGTIKCVPELVGYGLAHCDWSLHLTSPGEAIQSFYIYLTVYDEDGIELDQVPISRRLTGTLYPNYQDQTDFEGFEPGTYYVEVSGTVTGRYAVYGIAPVKSAEFTIPR